MTYQFDFSWLIQYLPLLWRGMLTLQITIIAVVCSTIVGLIAGQMRMSRNLLLRRAATWARIQNSLRENKHMAEAAEISNASMRAAVKACAVGARQ